MPATKHSARKKHTTESPADFSDDDDFGSPDLNFETDDGDHLDGTPSPEPATRKKKQPSRRKAVASPKRSTALQETETLKKNTIKAVHKLYDDHVKQHQDELRSRNATIDKGLHYLDKTESKYEALLNDTKKVLETIHSQKKELKRVRGGDDELKEFATEAKKQKEKTLKEVSDECSKAQGALSKKMKNPMSKMKQQLSKLIASIANFDAE